MKKLLLFLPLILLAVSADSHAMMRRAPTRVAAPRAQRALRAPQHFFSSEASRNSQATMNEHYTKNLQKHFKKMHALCQLHKADMKKSAKPVAVFAGADLVCSLSDISIAQNALWPLGVGLAVSGANLAKDALLYIFAQEAKRDALQELEELVKHQKQNAKQNLNIL